MVLFRLWPALAIGMLLISGCGGGGSTEPVAVAAFEPDTETDASTEMGVIQAGSPEPGGQAPDFALRDLDKNIVHLSDFRGKPVVLNFFASWCVPCLVEMPTAWNPRSRNWVMPRLVLRLTPATPAPFQN